MNVAYVRVSTVEQNDERQIEALKQYNIEKWFMEKISGKDMNRPKLQEMLSFVREGDVVYIHSFSRLARNTADMLKIIEYLKQHGVQLVSHKERLDTSTATGKLQLSILASINEFEREIIHERQLEGIAIAKAQGKYRGRKRVSIADEDFEREYQKYQTRKITKIELAQNLGISRSTLYRLLREKGLHGPSQDARPRGFTVIDTANQKQTTYWDDETDDVRIAVYDTLLSYGIDDRLCGDCADWYVQAVVGDTYQAGELTVSVVEKDGDS